MEIIKKVAIITLILLASVAGRAVAEGNCPPGYYPQSGPGFQGCAPGPTINMDSGSPAVVMDGYWESTWGALAGSRAVENTSVSVTGKRSEEEAKEAALAECREKGGGDGCVIDSVYSNYCVGVAADSVEDIGTFDGGPTKKKAMSAAVKTCARAGGKKCAPVFSDCTKPIYHKY